MIAECKHCQSASRTNTDSNSYSRGGEGAADGAGGRIYLVTRRWSAIRFLSGSDNEKVCCLLCASQNAYAGTGRAGVRLLFELHFRWRCAALPIQVDEAAPTVQTVS